MGREVTLVAVADLASLQTALVDGELDPCLLGLLHDLLTAPPPPEALATEGGPYDPERAWLATWAVGVVAANPGIGARRVELDRRFAWLGFVLDAVDPGCSAAIVGRHTLAAHTTRASTGVARSVQGFPFRFNTPADCEALAQRLASIEPAAITAAIRPEAMLDLYKFSEGQDTRPILADFLAVQALYAAVRPTESVLIVMD